MVFLGLGILFASFTFLAVRFLAFRFPRSRWREIIENWRQKKDNNAGKLSTLQKTDADHATIVNDVQYLDEPLLSSRSDIAGVQNGTSTNRAPRNTTFAPEPPKLERRSPVPTFQLDDAQTSRSFEAGERKSLDPERLITEPPAATTEVEKNLKPHKQIDSPIPAANSARPSKPYQSPPNTQQPPGLLMPPPARPNALRPLPKLANSLRPPPSLASTLRASPSQSRVSPSIPISVATSSTLPAASRPSRKVILPPGHSPLDWAHLTSHPPTPNFLRGASVPPQLIRVSPSQLREHNGRKGKDAWSTWQGKVYNVTPYRKFHPGGESELMRGAGKAGEAERLFLEIHPWVNWESMLGECMVGILVAENESSGNERDLEEMD
ncbi:hypothetical protein MMC13_000626 [Lambiella insularis]|nr:hypothetical protein [Lambiella insularis]